MAIDRHGPASVISNDTYVREEKVALVDVLSGKVAEDFNIFPTFNRYDTRLKCSLNDCQRWKREKIN